MNQSLIGMGFRNDLKRKTEYGALLRGFIPRVEEAG